MPSPLPLLLLLQQPVVPGAYTSPPTGDTVGYWQQRVAYRIVATLDESAELLRAEGDLWYVNNSPTPLGEIYLHQYLNAFRPHSAWSDADAREGRDRFQHLPASDQGFERFTRAPTVDGTPVRPEYPHAPDSTVVRLPLPRTLAPGDSVRIAMAWEARPSTVPRRQGRRGRSYDFAQWYPRVAVYDRGGWEEAPLVPAGEFYGEFGTYDVTLVVPADQVIGSTGVPVAGDPGWNRVRRGGAVALQRDAYGDAAAARRALPVAVPAGYRAVRWLARDVHHFAWSASPDYRYEGGAYVRPSREAMPFRTWDTVAVHVLYRPADDSTWGGGLAVERTIDALRWLEQVYGPYGYPQVTNLHRIESGGTEFPMMMMNGSASPGLILHELGHVYVHGMLANNEWRSGWMDEGLTSYVTSWAQGLTPQERAAAIDTARAAPAASGYRALAHTLSRDDEAGMSTLRLELSGHAEPVGTPAQRFNEFAVYNASVYTRASEMYAALRDVIGDDAFREFLRTYYRRWAFRHVDELAMRVAAEEAGRQQLTWFFDQWLRDTGLIDYSIEDELTVERDDGTFATRVAVLRIGRFAHPMPVGALTDSGWVIVRAEPYARRQLIEIITTQRPLRVQLDPLRVTGDWDRRNNVFALPLIGRNHVVVDWPFLRQLDRERNTLGFFPMAWWSGPGRATLGVRARARYLDLVDRRELGLAVATRQPVLVPAADGRVTPSPPGSQVQLWTRIENPMLPLVARPLMGHSVALALLDGVGLIRYDHVRDRSRFYAARGPRTWYSIGTTMAFPFDRNFLPEAWREVDLVELHASAGGQLPMGSVTPAGDAPLDTVRLRAAAYTGYTGPERGALGARVYGRVEAEAVRVRYTADTATAVVVRGFAGWNTETPEQRTLRAGSLDAVETFAQHWYRPRDAVLRQRGVHYVPLGGAGIRSAAPETFLAATAGANVEVARRLVRLPRSLGGLGLWSGVFADAALASPAHGTTFGGRAIADAGVGASVRGRLFDREIRLRVDLPLVASHPALTREGGGTFALRYVFSLDDWY